MAAPSVALSAEAKNEALDAITANVNSGRLKLYSGSPPADPDTAASGTLLATLTLNATAFAAASSGVATANAVTSGVAVTSGTAGYGRLTKSDTTTGVIDGVAGGSQRMTASSSSGLLLTTLTAHGRADTTPVQVFVESGGVLPTGLAANTTYYVRDSASTTFRLALTSGGSAIAYTDTGTAPFRVKDAATVFALATKDGAVAEGVTASVESMTLRM